jgi:hypothetical protein
MRFIRDLQEYPRNPLIENGQQDNTSLRRREIVSYRTPAQSTFSGTDVNGKAWASPVRWFA